MVSLPSLKNHQVSASSGLASRCSIALATPPVLTCPLMGGWPQREPHAHIYTGVTGRQPLSGEQYVPMPLVEGASSVFSPPVIVTICFPA